MKSVVTTDAYEFRLGLGHPVLELAATLAGRRTVPLERLGDPGDLSRWLELAGLARGVDCHAQHLSDARELREALYRLVAAARAKRRPTAADLELVNDWARRPIATPQLDASLRVTLVGSDPCRAALSQLAQAAIQLAGSADVHRIRECANPTCSLMYIDHSRPGRRRWCSMERCGNRVKTARYRDKRRGV